MKRYLFIIALLLCSCSEEEIIEPEGIYFIQSAILNGEELTLNSCQQEKHLEITQTKLKINSVFEDNNLCELYTTSLNYQIEDSFLSIEDKEDMQFSGTFTDENTIKLTTTYDGMTSTEVYKR